MSRSFARAGYVRSTLRITPVVFALMAASGTCAPAGGQGTADSAARPFTAPLWTYPVRPPDNGGAPDDPEPLVREHAAWALGRIGSPVTVETLCVRPSDE